MKKTLIWLLCACMLLSGCASQQKTYDIAATSLPVYQFTVQLCEGTDLTVTRLITESVSCLHDYSLTVNQVRAVEGAKTVVISGAGLEDLGKGLRSQCGTTYATLAKGPRYLELAEGYITKIAVDENDTIIGYKFVHLGKMMDMIKKGMDANEALEKASGQYGRVDDAAKLLDPREE